MSGLTSYGQKKLLDYVLAIASYTAPVGMYLSLHTTSPTDAGSLAGEVSASGTGYVRQLITGSMFSTDATTGESTNSAVISFPTITAEYGTVTYIGLNDAITGGNMVFWGAITEPQNKVVGESYQFSIGQLSVQLV